MKKILVLLFIVGLLFSSCANQKCPAYGEKQKFQRSYR